MPNPENAELIKIMTMTREDFLRHLSALFQEDEYCIVNHSITCQSQGGIIKIDLAQLKTLNLGAMKLPQLQLKFMFIGFSEAERCKFIRHLECMYHKGGG